MSYDSYFDNVSLLLHGNYADGFIDKSNVNNTFTAYGGAVIHSDEGIYFDGSDDYVIIVPNSSGFVVAENDYTIELTMNFLTVSSADFYRSTFGTYTMGFGSTDPVYVTCKPRCGTVWDGRKVN